MKFALTGAHGTGKTTLCKHLAATQVVGPISVCREMPRVIIEELNDNSFFQRANNTIERQLLLFTHQCVEESVLTSKSRTLLCDRTMVDHLAYTITLFPQFTRTVEYSALALAIAEWLKTYDRIFYVPIEFQVQADGVREGDEEFQSQIDIAITSLYASFGVQPIKIGGSIEERAAMIAANT